MNNAIGIRPHFDDILQQAQAFMQQEVTPLEARYSPYDFARAMPALHDKREQVKALGLWAPQAPTAFGGMGLSMMEHGLLCAILGRSPFGMYIFNAQAPDAGNMELLAAFGSAAQQETHLRPLVAGHIRSCFSMTERHHAGSNPLLMSTVAVREGDEYVITGHKWFTTAADGAAFAIVMAITQPEAAPHQRASMIIVPTDSPGFELVRNIPMLGHSGSQWDSHAEIRYHQVRVPVANRIGAEGSGFALAQTRLGPGRIHHCMRWMGICDRAFDMMCRYALSRPIGEGQVLADKQTIQNWIAESQAEIRAARLLIFDAAQKIDREGAQKARVEISTIKFYCAEVLNRVLDRALQTHGALGMTDDTLLSYWYSHERSARIYDGPDEVHKSSVAKQVLRQYEQP
jgi:alkylation response protein AidB-like acyl-CoA dehydrogenase